MVYFWINFPDAECSWAHLLTFDCCAVSLSDVIEVFSTSLKMIDPKTVSMLPSILDLVIAEPCLSIEGTLFIHLI